ALTAGLGDQPRHGAHRIEVFDDHARVEQVGSVVEHQHGNLAERIVLGNGRVGSPGESLDQLVLDLLLGQCDADLARIRTRERGDQVHRRRGTTVAAGCSQTLVANYSIVQQTERSACRRRVGTRSPDSYRCCATLVVAPRARTCRRPTPPLRFPRSLRSVPSARWTGDTGPSLQRSPVTSAKPP